MFLTNFRNQMERVMMKKMMDKIDQIISVVQPKKLLYVVLDGVVNFIRYLIS